MRRFTPCVFMRKVPLLLIVCLILAFSSLVYPEIDIPTAGGTPRQETEPARPMTGAESDRGEHEFLPRPILFWKFKSKGPFVAAPGLAREKILVGDKFGILNCLSAKDGRKQWSRRFSGYFLSSPVVDGESVFIALSRREVTTYRESGGGIFGSSPRVTSLVEEDGEVRCLDLHRGRRRWKRNFSRPVHSSPVPAGDRLVVGCLDYKVYCLDRDTGSIIWSYKTGGPVDASPVICDGRVLAGSRDGILYCLNLKGGRQYWQFNLGLRVTAAPVCEAGRVYVGADNKEVYCIDVQTGKPVWKAGTDGSLAASPLIYRGSIYPVTREGKIYCLRADNGKERWSHRLSRRFYSSPRPFAGSIMISSATGVIYCLDIEDGAVLWEYNLFSGAPAWLSLSGNRIFAASSDRKVYCLGERTGRR